MFEKGHGLAEGSYGDDNIIDNESYAPTMTQHSHEILDHWIDMATYEMHTLEQTTW